MAHPYIDLRLDYSFSLPTLDGMQIDSRLIRLLGGIADSGSLMHAAKAARISYRHAWGLIEKWSVHLGQPLAVFERGRGARLTPFAEKLLWADGHVRQELGLHLAPLKQRIQAAIADTFAREAAGLVVHASHDLALEALREFVKDRHALDLDLQFHGSLACLSALARGKVHLAGFHCGGGKHVRLECRRLLRPAAHRLISFVSRDQGLMVARGNPKGIVGVADLTRADVRFVNRQPGSGTRLEIDRMLEEYRIPARSVRGYDSEEFTHVAVAAMIAAGAADAGLGIRAAAAKYQLGFLPLLRERYFFACRKETLERAAAHHLLAALRDPAFRAIVSTLPGYSADDAGVVAGIDALADVDARDPSAA